MIKAMLRGSFGRRAPEEPPVDDYQYGELTMTSQTRVAAEKMMETLFAETDAMRADVVAEIEFCQSTIAALEEAATVECNRIDEEAAQRKVALRKMYGELAETERRRIAHAQRRLAILDGADQQAA